MKSVVKQIAFFALTAVACLVLYDIVLSEESKDFYWNSFNTHFDNVLLEETANQGKNITENYTKIFYETEGLIYEAGE